jgi:hypothetical protein
MGTTEATTAEKQAKDIAGVGKALTTTRQDNQRMGLNDGI